MLQRYHISEIWYNTCSNFIQLARKLGGFIRPFLSHNKGLLFFCFQFSLNGSTLLYSN